MIFNIQELIHHSVLFVNTIGGNNQFLTAAIGAWVMGVGTYLFRNVPHKIAVFVKTQSTVSVTFNNYTNWDSMYLFNKFSEWFVKSYWFKFSRTHSLDYSSVNEENRLKIVVGPGYGFHFFIFERKFYWFYKSQDGQNQASNNKEIIEIHCFGRTKKNLFKLIEKITPNNKDKDIMTIYTINSNNSWEKLAESPYRSMDSVILKDSIKNDLISNLDSYVESKEWYKKRGIQYKLSFLLYGKPGTGKTSIVKAVASYLERDIFLINLNQVSDHSLTSLIQQVEKNSVILIEDIDSFSAVKERTLKDSHDESSKTFKSLSLSGILNILDGVAGLDDVIVFMTTNFEERIDSALKRKGRTDHVIEIPYLETEEIKKYIKFVYGEDVKGSYKDIPGCELQSLVIKHKKDFDGFINEFNEKYKSSTMEAIK